MNTAKEITSLINAVRDLCNVGICYYDLKDFFHYNRYGVKNNLGHYCDFCEKTRLLAGGREYCDKSDKIEAIRLAEEYKEPFFFECHMGIKELVVPLFQRESLIGVLFVGQCRSTIDNSAQVRQGTQRLNGDCEEMLRLYNKLPLVLEKDLLNIGKILFQYFKTQIINNELLPQEDNNLTVGGLASAIYNYIENNYKSPIFTGEIAKKFHVNASYASRVFHKKYGITITERISLVRVNHAKTLLEKTFAPINSIAINVGFSDSNYFTRIFKKRVGVSPQQYRKQITAKETQEDE